MNWQERLGVEPVLTLDLDKYLKDFGMKGGIFNPLEAQVNPNFFDSKSTGFKCLEMTKRLNGLELHLSVTRLECYFAVYNDTKLLISEIWDIPENPTRLDLDDSLNMVTECLKHVI